MNDAAAGPMVTIKTEPPDAGPRALRGALLGYGLGAAVVTGDVWWVGFRTAIDITSRDFNPIPFFVVVCAAVVGTIALVSGILHTVRFRKFGSSELTIGEPRLGETLKGLVRTSRDLVPLDAFKARLRCDLHTSMTNSRGGRTSATACLWESVQAVPATARSSAGLPIEFAIPGNGLVSGARNRKSGADERVSWALEIVAPLRGLPYYAEFPIPMKGRQQGREERGSGSFAGCDPPRSGRWKWLLRALVMFGGLVTVAGTFGIVDELRSARVTGRITAFHSGTLDVAVGGSDSSSVTAHVTHLPAGSPREPGMAIALVCGAVKEDTYSCDPDTGLRWWIQTGIGMSAGLAMLLVALVLWRRRRWWA